MQQVVFYHIGLSSSVILCNECNAIIRANEHYALDNSI